MEGGRDFPQGHTGNQEGAMCLLQTPKSIPMTPDRNAFNKGSSPDLLYP